jgi:hypothetical protein
MRSGRRLPGLPDLARSRMLAAAQLKQLPEPLRLPAAGTYPVRISRGLTDLANRMTCSRRRP